MHYGHGDAITLREYSDWHSPARTLAESVQGRRRQQAARERAAQAERRGTANLGLFSQQQAETFARLVASSATHS
jgi:hypothetical protein